MTVKLVEEGQSVEVDGEYYVVSEKTGRVFTEEEWNDKQLSRKEN